MNIRDRRAIHHTAARVLGSAPGNPTHIMLIYAGVSCLLALLITVITQYLDKQIANTGGLSNIGLRSALSTILYLLPVAQSFFLLCWELGYTASAMKFARMQEATPGTLLTGFRHIAPLLSSSLLQVLIYLALGIFSFSISSNIFLMTPFSRPFIDAVTPVLSEASVLNPDLMMDEATMAAISGTMLPMLVIFCIVYAILVIPAVYRYRMVPFCLLDLGRGGFTALRTSRHLMRRNRFALFRLDLSFWWYYLLHFVAVALAYGDTLLSLMGIILPLPKMVSFYLFYILSLAMQLVIFYFSLNKVSVSYVIAYDSLRNPNQDASIVNL